VRARAGVCVKGRQTFLILEDLTSSTVGLIIGLVSCVILVHVFKGCGSEHNNEGEHGNFLSEDWRHKGEKKVVRMRK